MLSAQEVVGLLADERRLRVVAAVVLGAQNPAEVVAATGIDLKSVMKALARLDSAGLVTGGDQLRLELHQELLREAAMAPREVEDHGAAPEQEKVLRAFLRGGRLTHIPTGHSKRLVILDHVARVFDLGVQYPEKDVNALLKAFHEDYAALRRYLVDEGFLTREGGVYWRSGGTVDV